MRISLLTDAPKHNLALMKISAWHKAQGDEVELNMPIFPADRRYASVLFSINKNKFKADEYGGPAFEWGFDDNEFTETLPVEIEKMKPDYNLFRFQRKRNNFVGEVVEPTDYSLGYTFRPCYRNCSFCLVHTMRHPDTEHHSIWEFHDTKFKKICLLNNNTFFDPRWKETFEEIWDANLIVIDENGYDLRLMDEEKAEYLRRTKFQGQIHYAWDRMEDEKKSIEGLKIAPKGSVYVLIGYNTTIEEDIYRCQIIHDLKHDPYIMPYNGGTKQQRAFKRFIDTRMYRKYKTIKEAWRAYK